MKKLFLVALSLALICSLSACSGSQVPQSTEQIPDLTGNWKESNPDSDDSYHEAVIRDGTIEVYWSGSDDTKSLYWAGTYIAPTTAENPYSWESANDKDKTDVAMLASGDDTKLFTYENGILSYSVSAFGTTKTARLEKQ